MNTRQVKVSVAEQIDRMMQRIALGVFLVAIAYGLSIAEFFVSTQTNEILNNVMRVLGVGIFVLVLPQFLKFLMMRHKYSEACKEPEGFVIEMFDKATGKAFQFTFLFLVPLEFASDGLLSHLPGEFFIKLIIMVTLAIFSLTFFFLNRAGDAPGPEDEFSNGDTP